MKKEIKITLEQAKELLITIPSLKDVIYSNFPELKSINVPDSFEGLGSISGWFIESSSYLSGKVNLSSSTNNRNVFKTEQQAQSALAMAQLSQLMAATGDCNVDWTDSTTSKYCIVLHGKDYMIGNYISVKFFLAFNTKSVAEEFLIKHIDLIKQYYGY